MDLSSRHSLPLSIAATFGFRLAVHVLVTFCSWVYNLVLRFSLYVSCLRRILCTNRTSHPHQMVKTNWLTQPDLPASSTFRLFPQLPGEIRQMIWYHAASDPNSSKAFLPAFHALDERAWGIDFGFVGPAPLVMPRANTSLLLACTEAYDIVSVYPYEERPFDPIRDALYLPGKLALQQFCMHLVAARRIPRSAVSNQEWIHQIRHLAVDQKTLEDLDAEQNGFVFLLAHMSQLEKVEVVVPRAREAVATLSPCGSSSYTPRLRGGGIYEIIENEEIIEDEEMIDSEEILEDEDTVDYGEIVEDEGIFEKDSMFQNREDSLEDVEARVNAIISQVMDHVPPERVPAWDVERRSMRIDYRLAMVQSPGQMGRFCDELKPTDEGLDFLMSLDGDLEGDGVLEIRACDGGVATTAAECTLTVVATERNFSLPPSPPPSPPPGAELISPPMLLAACEAVVEEAKYIMPPTPPSTPPPTPPPTLPPVVVHGLGEPEPQGSYVSNLWAVPYVATGESVDIRAPEWGFYGPTTEYGDDGGILDDLYTENSWSRDMLPWLYESDASTGFGEQGYFGCSVTTP
ncbi:hypothetical protein B0T14DRAFT_576493 [Immersiella caudata]|uniref:2EXR domain-containing protein n=1 Tax=Immersiella caudata TaxID=314043 RepID=A0AA39XHH4_9PEZI|nr:hypothetical protein B0T14DRAFT_576493 [Immersiella caudata]